MIDNEDVTKELDKAIEELAVFHSYLVLNEFGFDNHLKLIDKALHRARGIVRELERYDTDEVL